MAEVTLTDEQQKALVEETKKQLIASAKSVQDFEKITELPESGSVTLPVVQPDGSTKTFDAGNWLKDRETAYKATQSATNAANAATDAANAAAASANNAATEANSAADAANTATDKANAATASANNATQSATNAANAANAATDKANAAAEDSKEAAQVAKDAKSEVNALLEAFSTDNQFCGFARQNGTASGDAATTYGSKALIHEIGSHFHLGTVKNGEIQHTAVGGRLTKATNGDDIAIDGSDGDVYCFWDREINLLKDTADVNGVETNVIGLSLLPAVWQQHPSKVLPMHGISAMGEVYAKIDGDVRQQQHCIYNPNVAGTYSAPNGVFKGSYKKSGGGYPTQYTSCVQSIQRAQAKNEDALTNRPYTGEYYEFYEVWCALMFAELGSLKHTALDVFGTGLTPMDSVNATTFNDDTISANSGWKVIVSDTDARYFNVWGDQAITLNGTKQNIVGGVAGGSWYGIVEMLEPQRVLDAIADAGLVSMIGDKSHIFYYGDDGTMKCSTDGSIDVSTGKGMTALKHYFVVRNVPNCEGMADGVMTAVVNSYTVFEFSDGATIASDGTSLTGKKAILKRSMAVYRGKILPYCYGCFEQLDGAFYVIKVDANGNITMEFRCAEDIDDIPARKSFGYEAPVDGEADIEKGLSKIKKYASNLPNEFWAKACDYSLSLFCVTLSGGGNRSQENMYLWVYPSNNAGKGKRQVHGSVVGCCLIGWNASASVRSLYGSNHAGNGYAIYVGASAVLLSKKQNKNNN